MTIIENNQLMDNVFQMNRDELSDIMMRNLTRLMKENCILNYRELAEESGINYVTILSFCKRGLANTQFSTLMKIMRYFNCTLSDLILR